jgi:hypothetical protein
LQHALFHRACIVEANLVGKKARQAQIGHFTRSIQGKSRFRVAVGSDDIRPFDFSRRHPCAAFL